MKAPFRVGPNNQNLIVCKNTNFVELNMFNMAHRLILELKLEIVKIPRIEWKQTVGWCLFCQSRQ